MVKFDYNNSSINDRMIFEFDSIVKENNKWILRRCHFRKV